MDALQSWWDNHEHIDVVLTDLAAEEARTLAEAVQSDCAWMPVVSLTAANAACPDADLVALIRRALNRS